VCSVVCKILSKLECMILTTLFLACAKNTNSQRIRKVDLQRAFPLDILMVPSSVPIVITSCEHLSSDVFSLGQTIHFRSLEFIADHFDGLSLSPMGNGSDTAIMSPTCGGLPSPPRAMIGDYQWVPHDFVRGRED
jgi:hypothetical protein